MKYSTKRIFFRNKNLRFIIFTCVISIIGFISLKAYVYNFFIEYKVYYTELPAYKVENIDLKKFIDDNCEGKSRLTVDDIVSKSMKLTKNALSFSTELNSNNPNVLINNDNAHCVGYATFFSAVCNYLIEREQLNSKWIAKPERGELYFLGINIHKYLGSSSFVRNHDFVCIENLSDQTENIYVDPSLYEFTLIERVRIIEEIKQ